MANFLRISVQGTMPGGEVWSVNPVYGIGGDFGVPVSAAQVVTVANALATAAVPTTLMSMMTPGCALTSYRVEARKLDGTLEALAEGVRATPLAGNGAQRHPYQTSVVTSLRTPLPGASGRGRLYWVATAVALDNSTLRVDAASVTSHLAAVKTFLSTMQTVVDATFDGVSLCVWSRKNAALTAVNSIQMGNVVDQQRRRRDALTENYSALSYP